MRKAPVLLLLILPLCTSCRSLSRDLNKALPEFMRASPGGEEMKLFKELHEGRDWSADDLERQDRLHAEVVRVYTAADWEECAEQVRDYLDDYGLSRYDQELRFLLADSLYRDDEWDNAYDSFKEYLALYPVSSWSEPSMQILYRMGLGCIEGQRSAFLGIFGRRAKGVEILRMLVETFPGGSRAADAQWALARYSMSEGEYEAAALEYRVLTERWPESEWNSAALYYTAWCGYRQMKGAAYDAATMKHARESFERYLLTARQQGWAGEARAALTDISEMEAQHLLVVAEWYLDMDKPWAARFWLMKLSVLHASTAAGQKAKALLATLPGAETPPIAVPMVPATGNP
ncbi:MAG: outer membrane protein assembly factor BamD [Planctomycetes bacterium]|nr:outer membrane protein assembly factor BamD [Planctomycetota bacterium]